MAKKNKPTALKLVPVKKTEKKEPKPVQSAQGVEKPEIPVGKLKSKAKAAGVKSVFGIGESVLMTSFGRGNSAVLEKRVEEKRVENLQNPEAYSATPEKRKFSVRGAMAIKAKGESEGKRIEAHPDYPRTPGGKLGMDQIGAKEALETRYFGRTFDDNIHIQLIYNILDIDKTLAVFLNHIVYSINNLKRDDDPDGQGHSDLLGLGKTVSVRRTLDELISSSDEKAKEEFNDLVNNPRLCFFGRAFFTKSNENDKKDKKGEKKTKGLVRRDDASIYDMLSILSQLRQSCFHDDDKSGDKLGRAAVYNLDKWIPEERLKILDTLLEEKLADLKNFTEYNKRCNFTILFETFNAASDEQKKKIACDYYRFVMLKDYKNLGFSIKKLREVMIDKYLKTLKDKEYDSVRGKLYGMIDFILVQEYESDSARLDRLVSRLRAAASEGDKEEIYLEESDSAWQKCAGKIAIANRRVSMIKNDKKAGLELKGADEELVREAVNTISVTGKMTRFTELIYMMTLFIDGKEVNDLLTDLINRFDNIASFLRIIRSERLYADFTEDYSFFNADTFFDKFDNAVVLEELKKINGFAKMTVETDAAKKIMYKDAVLLLGVKNGSDDELEEYVDEFLDKEKVRVKDDGKPDFGFRNFIASNVIESRRFRYIIRFMNPNAAHKMTENERLVQFVLKKMPDTIIDRYCESCGCSLYAGREDKINELASLVMGVQTEFFRNVNQSANAETNAEKQRYVTIMSLYLNVLYQITKNLVNINSRYVIAFHNLERDGKLLLGKKVSHTKYNQRDLAQKYVEDRRLKLEEAARDMTKAEHYYKQYGHEKRVIDYCEQDLNNCDEVIIAEFRNSVAHLSAIRNASKYVGTFAQVGGMNSYFELYHFIIQKSIGGAFEYAKQKGRILNGECGIEYEATDHRKIPVCEKSVAYINRISNPKWGSYIKDFVKAYCSPFIYNLARFKNLSIDILFDRNEEREKTKKNTALRFGEESV